MSRNGIIKMKCELRRIRYFNGQDWGIILVNPLDVTLGNPIAGDDGWITLKGNMPKPKLSCVYEVAARYVKDEKWGDQYEIINITSGITVDKNDIETQKQYLLTIFTEKQVEKMYDVKGLNPFEAFVNEDVPQLLRIKGCGMKTVVQWLSKFKSNYNLMYIFKELKEYQITNKMAERLLDKYSSPELVVEKVKTNPYILATEVEGIGWATADQLAMDGGMKENDPKRIGAYILYILKNEGQKGFAWITCDQLLGTILESLGENLFDEEITAGIHEIEDKLWWNEDHTAIGLKMYYNTEQKIAEELIRLRNAESKLQHSNNWEDAIRHMEQKQGWNYTEEQIQGIKLTLDNNVTLIQGVAGSGKTSIVAGMLEVFKGYSFVQAALSGRAGARMAEVTGEQGYTIHRLLGYPKGPKEKGKYKYHNENQLPYDIYILDEISMVNDILFYELLRAIPDGSKLICLGDSGQLESIGSGNIAYDMMCSNEIPSLLLTKIHRQAERSAIVTESLKVRNGSQLIEKDWVGEEIRGELKDLTLTCFSDSSNTFYEVMKAFSKLMNTSSFQIMDNQIIVPVKAKGDACCAIINNQIQEIYNPGDGEKKETLISVPGRQYILREGDKVINITNNYNVNPQIYNGNIGIIKKIDFDEDEGEELMEIEFLGIGTVKLPQKYWKSIDLAYACTVHKLQGSQFKNVIFALDFSAYVLLSKELIYTGITRASKHCHLIAQTGALRMATAKDGVSVKQTHLQKCLHDVAHPKLIF